MPLVKRLAPLPFLGVTDGNEPVSLGSRAAPSVVAARLRTNFNLGLENVASKAAKDVERAVRRRIMDDNGEQSQWTNTYRTGFLR